MNKHQTCKNFGCNFLENLRGCNFFRFTLYVQNPSRLCDRRALYVIDSAERLALTSLPVMSPEVVRCVWNEHRRLRDVRVVAAPSPADM